MVESLYFMSYYALLKGNLTDCRMYFDFLKEEHKSNPNHKKLNKYQLIGLKCIIDALKTGRVSVFNPIQNSTLIANIPSAIAPQRQDEIVERIHKEAFSELSSLISVKDGFHLANIEHPCPPYGAVDMFYLDSEAAYPLEVKKDRGEHDLIGQVMKYDLFFKLQLHLKFYHVVRPITVCGSYDDFTLNELKKMGVITLKYKLEDKLKLSLL